MCDTVLCECKDKKKKTISNAISHFLDEFFCLFMVVVNIDKFVCGVVIIVLADHVTMMMMMTNSNTFNIEMEMITLVCVRNNSPNNCNLFSFNTLFNSRFIDFLAK